MFSKSIVVALFALALSVEAVPANRFSNGNKAQPQCGTISTVVRTVTVTARGTTATNVNKGNQANNNNGSKTTSTKAAAATTKAATNNNNNNNNQGNNNNNNNKGNNNNAGTKTTSTKAAAQTTAAANGNNGGNKGGLNNGGNNAGNNNNGNPQTSTTLDPRVIASGFANNGQDIPTAGQVASLTSTNNFMNFCLTVPNLPITNGKQITTGSCNPAPIGLIPSVDNMPSSKFTFPANFGTIKANTAFQIKMAIQKMQTGFFVNAQENYFSAPQQLNGAGQIQGHSHVVIEALTSLDQTTPTDPKKFAFFKGLNAAASGGILTADVTGGLAAGFYKLSSINTAANHQPVIVPVAQHGSLDDAIYFTVTADGKPVGGGNNAGNNSGKNLVGTTTPATAVTSVASSVKGAATSAASSAKGATTAASSSAKGNTAVAPSAKGTTSVKGAAATTVQNKGAVAPAAETKTAASNNGSKNNGSKVVSSAAPAKSSEAAKTLKANGRFRRMVKRQA